MPAKTHLLGRRPTFWLVGLTLIGLALPPAHAGPQAAQAAQNRVPVSEETTLLAQGWAALATGNALAAADIAQQILGKYRQSVGGLALAVEAAITRGGAMAGLTTYESWLESRRLENPFVIRRIAMAVLREKMNAPSTSGGSAPRGRLVALKALGAEGDAEALSKLAQNRDQVAETRVMAELGNQQAVQDLIRRLESAAAAPHPQAGQKVAYIEALANTKNRMAIAPIRRLLDDPDPLVVAAAADALGKLDAKEAIPQLRTLVEGPIGPVRWPAARSLSLMGDSGGVAFLRERLVFDPAREVEGAIVTPGAGDYLQAQAAEALAPLGPNADWINTARRLLGSPDPQARLLAAKVIAPQDQPVAKDVLEALLLDSNPGISQEATDILASRVAGDFVTLRRLLRSADAYSQALAAARIVELTR
jgi:hypothetical protein